MTDPAPIHLRPAAPLAPRVLLPGDPHRALAVAQALLDQPRMFNHNRGLWGYTGRAADGDPLTVQATGMGGPSAAIVVEELIDLGARTLLRIGTCGALADGLELGALVAAEEAIGADGTTVALLAAAEPGDGARAAGGAEPSGTEVGGALPRLRPDGALQAALVAGGALPATVLTTDLFYDPGGRAADGWRRTGADVVEMEAATLLAVADRRGVAAAAVLAVTDLLGGDADRERIDADGLEQVGLRLGEAGWAALAAAGAAERG